MRCSWSRVTLRAMNRRGIERGGFPRGKRAGTVEVHSRRKLRLRSASPSVTTKGPLVKSSRSVPDGGTPCAFEADDAALIEGEELCGERPLFDAEGLGD